MKEFKLDLPKDTQNVQLAFNLTGDCNLSCSYCAVKPGETEHSGRFDPIEIKRIYDEVRLFHPNSFLEILCLAKGEPMLNWEAIEMVETIRQSDERVTCFIPTNGTLNSRKIYSLAKKDWLIQVSYDGINNEITRGESENVKATLKGLSRINGSKYIVRMTLTPDNISSINESLDQLKSFGARFVSLGPVAKLGRNVIRNDSIILQDFLDAIFYAKDIGINPMTPIKEACSLATRGYYFNPDGQLSICYTQNITPSYEMRQLARKQGCALINLEKIFL